MYNSLTRRTGAFRKTSVRRAGGFAALGIPEPQRKPEIRYTKLFINNEWVDSADKSTFQTINPSTGEVIADIAEGKKADIDNAVHAAEQAFKIGSPWRRMNPSDRGILMNKWADQLDKHRTYLASLETLDNGKPYLMSYLGDVDLSIKCYRYYAGLADKLNGQTFKPDGDLFSYSILEPVGVCGQIIPWNFPMLMQAWKLGPALAAGNCVVMKPAEQTPLSANVVAQLAKEVGFPEGVLNIVPGFGPTAGQALIANQAVEKVAFTGSSEVGRLIQRASAENLQKVTLELGGKSPFIVLNDADLDTAVEMAHSALFFNMGECCTASSRIFVQDGIHDAFVEKSRVRALKRTVGDPFLSGTEQGPQIDCEQQDKIMALIQTGRDEGATLQCGGATMLDRGFYIQPTVFSDVTDEMAIATDEIFGPVMQVLRFKDIDEVIERANNSRFGLAAGVCSNDINSVIKISHSLRAGTVWVNTYHNYLAQAPFGGYKESGTGRELGMAAMDAYTESKTVTMKTLPRVW